MLLRPKSLKPTTLLNAAAKNFLNQNSR